MTQHCRAADVSPMNILSKADRPHDSLGDYAIHEAFPDGEGGNEGPAARGYELLLRHSYAAASMLVSAAQLRMMQPSFGRFSLRPAGIPHLLACSPHHKPMVRMRQSGPRTRSIALIVPCKNCSPLTS